VCSEETLEEILRRYQRYNAHAASYTWKYDAASLTMDRTLAENGITDEDEELDRCRLDRDLFTPAISLHFNDDLTELWPPHLQTDGGCGLVRSVALMMELVVYRSYDGVSSI